MNTASLLSLRFLAAMIVILFHSRSNDSAFFKVVPNILLAGPQMATFFFVLSGFGLVLAYYGKTYFSYREYWAKRAARIIPIYLLALVSVIIVNIIEGGRLDLVALILHLSFLQSWFPSYPLSLNYFAWFISDLFFFYATFPLILSYIHKSDPNPKRFLLLALSLWLFTQIILTILLNTSFYRDLPSSSHDLIYYFPPCHFLSFFLGVAMGYLAIKSNVGYLPNIRSNLLILISCFLLILFIESEHLITQAIELELPFGVNFYAPLFMLVIFAFSTSNGLFANMLAAKPLVFLGEISFSIYIMQLPATFITNSISTLLYNANIVFDSYEILLSIHFAILIIIGIILHYTVEKPVKTAVKNRFSQAQ